MERLLYNSQFEKSFSNMPKFETDVIILIINAHSTYIAILDVNGLSDDEKNILAKKYLNDVTFGCNYKYKIVQQVNNVYFCD